MGGRERAMSTEPGEDHRIVVGVDGSLASQQALAWAVGQAELTGASVEAVTAWHYPVVIGGMPYPPLAVLEEADFGRFAAITLSDAISAAVPKTSPVTSAGPFARGMRPRFCWTPPTARICWS